MGGRRLYLDQYTRLLMTKSKTCVNSLFAHYVYNTKKDRSDSDLTVSRYSVKEGSSDGSTRQL